MRIHLSTYFPSVRASIHPILILCAALLVSALLLFLGTWQLNRGYAKQSLLETQKAAEQSDFVPLESVIQQPIDRVRYVKTKATGKFLNHHTFLLDNQMVQGRVGYHVLTPFKTHTHQVILVHRGWVPAPMSRTELPDISFLEAEVTIEGRIEKGYVNPLISKALESSEIQWPLRVQYVDFELFEKLLKTPLPKMTLQLSSPTEGVLSPIASTGEWLSPERHFGYAFQWYSLFALLWILILITFWRSSKT